MELGPSPALDLATAVDPLSRGLPDLQRSQGPPPDASAALAPFEMLLKLLGNPLPDVVPSGQALPAGGGALPIGDAAQPPSTTDTDAASLDAAAQVAAALTLPLPLPPALPAAATPDGAAPIAPAAHAQAALADAVRLAFAAGPRPPTPAAPPTIAPAADTIAAPAGTAAPRTDDAQPAPALPKTADATAAQSAAPADLDVLLALDVARASAPPTAEPFALRARASEDNRARPTAAAPAERALSLATELARADAASARMDAPRPLDLDAPAAATAAPAAAPAIKITRFADALPIDVTAPPIGTDVPAAGSSTLAPPASHATNGASTAAAQASAQSPGNPGTPLDTQSARWHDALASRVHWLVDHAVGEAQIKLNPPELGALDVKISMLDDKTFVQMTAHTSAARDELTQSLPRLRELMSASGLDLGGATVSGGRDDRSGYAAAAHPVTRAHAFAADSADLDTDPLPRLRLPSSSRIDLFA